MHFPKPLTLFLIFCAAVNFGWTQRPEFTSNLPILVIETVGTQAIPDEPKITAHLGVVWDENGGLNSSHGFFNHYNGRIGIEGRGNKSQDFPKLPYTFETRLEDGSNNNVKLLGMPKENDWILRAGFIDKTLMRDAVAYHLGRSTGRWAPRTRHCEVILNDEYLGVYTLVESIKPDKNRLNIAKMDADDAVGDSLTGGYIYEISQDGPDFGRRRRYVYPKADNITSEQSNYIRKYVEDFRRVMQRSDYDDPVAGYAAWIDRDSFIDEILVQEAVKNSDTYGWSSYFHKDRLGKLCAGPLWDFDQSLSNSTFNDGDFAEEWIIEKSEYDDWLEQNYPPFWNQLWYEPKFKKQLAERWFDYRKGVFSDDRVTALIDSLSGHLMEAQQRNFERWPVLGAELWRSPSGWRERDTYEKEVAYMKSFLLRRMQWMDEQLESFASVDPDRSALQVSRAPGLAVYPNPAGSVNWFQYTLAEAGQVALNIYNVRGRRVTTLVSRIQPSGTYTVSWPGLDQRGCAAAPGLYLCVLKVDRKIMGRAKWMRF